MVPTPRDRKPSVQLLHPFAFLRWSDHTDYLTCLLFSLSANLLLQLTCNLAPSTQATSLSANAHWGDLKTPLTQKLVTTRSQANLLGP